MPLNGITKTLNNATKTPYKEAIFLKKGMVYDTKYYGINEKIVTPWGIYRDNTPIYIKNNVHTFAWEIENAINYILSSQESEDEKQKKLMDSLHGLDKIVMEFNVIKEYLKNNSGMSINLTDAKQNPDSLDLFVDKVPADEWKATCEMQSYMKATKTQNKEGLKMNGGLIIFIGFLLVVAVLGYMIFTGKLAL